MTVQAGLAFTLDGVPVAQLVAGSPDLPEALLVDVVDITWGRKSMEETYPEPSRLAFILLDTTPGRVHVRRRAEWIGRPVTVGSVVDGVTAINFRGLVDEVDVASVRLRGRTVSQLTFRAVGLEAEAANYITPVGSSWPEESVTARVARLNSILGGLLTIVTPVFDAPNQLQLRSMIAGNYSETDVLTLARDVHAQAGSYPGAVLVYRPDTNQLVSVARRVLTTFVGQLQVLSGARAGRFQATSRSVAGYVNGPTQTAATATKALGIDGGTVEHIGRKLTLNPAGGITQVEVTLEHPVNRFIYTKSVPGASPGRRTLSTKSLQLSTDHASDRLLNGWADVASKEMKAWNVGLLRLDTARTGGFENADHARLMLAGWEQPDYWFLQNGSELVANGVRPYFGIIGGRLVYSGGSWLVDFLPADVASVNPPPPLKARYAASSTAVRLDQLDATVTPRDLEFVNIGAGYDSTTQPTQ